MTPSSPTSTVDSLFDEVEDDGSFDGEYAEPQPDLSTIVPARRTPPPIPGLYVFPALLPADLASSAIRDISDADHFVGGARDQVMLFSSPPPAPCSLPAHIQALDRALSTLLTPHLPENVHAVVFKQPLSRQAILNLYEPGQGISPHIDLPHRYADGIVGASLAGGCVLVLERAGERHDVYLPPRSVYVFSGEVRWEWTHGIPGREYDVVLEDCGEEMTLPRDVRVSATLRWMKEGADLLVEEGERPA